MNRARYNLILFLVWLWPVAGWAQGLPSPTYFPVGPMPFWLTMIRWPFMIRWPSIILILLSIAVETFVLWTWAPRLGRLGSLWRAAVLYFVARAAETIMFFALQSVPLFRFRDGGAVALYIGGGLILAVPVGLLLYRGSGLKGSRVVMAVCTASLAGYFAALGYSLMLVRIL